MGTTFTFIIIALAMPILLILLRWSFEFSNFLKAKVKNPILIVITSSILFVLLFLDLLPEALHDIFLDNSENTPHINFAFLILGLGCLTPYIAEELLSPLFARISQPTTSYQKNCHNHDLSISLTQTCTVLSCFTLCSFFDGVRLATVFLTNSTEGWIFFGAVFIHLAPQVFILHTFHEHSKSSLKVRKIFWSFFLGSFPAGVLSLYLLKSVTSGSYLLLFSSGLILNLLFSELIPMATKVSKNKIIFMILCFVFTFLFYLILEPLEGLVHSLE